MAFAVGFFDKNSGKASIGRWQFHSWHGGICRRTFDPLNDVAVVREKVDRGKMKLFPLSSPPIWNKNNSRARIRFLSRRKKLLNWRDLKTKKLLALLVKLEGKDTYLFFLMSRMTIAFLRVLRDKKHVLRENVKTRKERNRSSISYDKRYRNRRTFILTSSKLASRFLICFPLSPFFLSFFIINYHLIQFVLSSFVITREIKGQFFLFRRKIAPINSGNSFRRGAVIQARFRLQIYRVVPDAAYILGHFFPAASF